MNEKIVIIGGGLSGLSLSIDLAKRGIDVVVIEKGDYPRHKVCGEYISLESYNYLQTICPAISELQLPLINQFMLTSTGEKEHHAMLDLGGFGISRYLLENLLYCKAKEYGVAFHLNSKAMYIQANPEDGFYTVDTKTDSIQATLVCNSSGRKSNFEHQKYKSDPQGTNYVGIKYHVQLERNPRQIEIHNFPGGYCGISNIENDQSCLCYIVNSKMLHQYKNSIPLLEENILYKNKHLKEIFSNATFLNREPLTISGINFRVKQAVNEHSFLLGDAAGTIAPISGNGMSMGLRSASVLANQIENFISKKISRKQLKEKYEQFWNKEFSSRIQVSRRFQQLSESPALANFTIGILNTFPFLAKKMMAQTHGKPF